MLGGAGDLIAGLVYRDFGDAPLFFADRVR
jgi:hypothetical protein